MTQKVDPIKAIEKKHANPENKAKGIPFKEAKEKVRRIAGDNWSGDRTTQVNLMNSIRNQAVLAEGEDAGDAIVNEVVKDMPARKTLGYKSRPGGWTVSICLKECVHKDTEVCTSCLHFSHLEPKEK